MDKAIFIILGIGMVFGQLVQIPIGEIDAPLIDIAVLIVLVVGLIPVFAKKLWPSSKQLRLLWPIGLFALAAILSFLFNLGSLSRPEALISGLYLARLVGYLLISLVVVLHFSIKKTTEYARWLLWLIVSFAVIGMLQLAVFPDFSIFEYFGWDPHQGRLLSTFLDPNFAGLWLTFGIGVCWALWFRLPNLGDRIALSLAGLLLLLGNFLTFSRSALVGLVVLLFSLVTIKNWRWLWVLVVLVSLFVLSSPRLQDRISGIWQVDATVAYRLESWQGGIRTWLTHPIFGVGYNTLPYRRYENALPGTVKLVDRASSGFDSSLITVAATTGTVGLISFLLVILWGIRMAASNLLVNRNRIFSLLLLATTTTLLVASWFVNAWLYGPMLLTWLIVFALATKERDD